MLGGVRIVGPVSIAGTDPDQIGAQQARAERQSEYARLERDARRDDLFAVLSTLQGRRFLDMLTEDAGYRAPSYVKGSADHSAYQEGRRSVAIELMQRCESQFPELLQQLTQERHDRNRNRAKFLGA